MGVWRFSRWDSVPDLGLAGLLQQMTACELKLKPGIRARSVLDSCGGLR